MTRVLLIGFGPMPIEKLRMSGPSLRTWHFLKVLLEAGHEVCLIANRGHDVYPTDLPPVVSQRKDRWTYHSLTNETWWGAPETVKALIRQWNPDCAVAVTTPATATAARLVHDLPLWGDLYGSIMAEAQSKALVYNSDSYLPHFWQLEVDAVRRGDKFSAVSQRQQWSLIGELGLLGRLNQHTSGYEFATTIPIAGETEPYVAREKRLRGVVTPDDAFIMLYSGGYNTWCDVDTLFQALERVLADCPHAYFVSTGGQIVGHDDRTYERFCALIQGSAYRERYKLQGWIPAEHLPDVYLESNVGLNTDRLSYEALLGSRTRVLDWMRAGLPCVLSNLTELAADLAAAGAGLTYTPGDAEELAAQLMRCAADRAFVAQMGEASRRLLLDRFTYAATSRCLLEWADQPTHAPDFGRGVILLGSPDHGTAHAAPPAEAPGILLRLLLRVWAIVQTILYLVGVSEEKQAKITHTAKRLLAFNRYAATYRQITIPSQMEIGRLHQIPVTVTNAGRATWLTPQQAFQCVNLSYHWRTTQGALWLKEGLRTPLPRAVSPGESISLLLAVEPPTQPGRYRLELDLVQEGAAWFSDIDGLGPSAAVEVVQS